MSLPQTAASTEAPQTAASPAAAHELPDIAELARQEASLVRGLAEILGETRSIAGLAFARARHCLDGTTVNPAAALPHIGTCGGLGARLVGVYDRSLRTIAHHRRDIVTLAANRKATRPS